MGDGDDGHLPGELRALGRGLGSGKAADIGWGSAGDSMAEQVLARIIAEAVPIPVPVRAEPSGRFARIRAWARGRRRAGVADRFTPGGFEVRYAPAVRVPEADAPARGRTDPGTPDDKVSSRPR
ncbi:hypothetical protein OG709_22365 [Streptomyces sp. NBC_01267]|uniref:hypothetical protein n=1 Tax=unclassified Streptomyces TaxID=2593676 RepID=UPI002E352F0C|nr:hypothetical protein [Streptomyces sp. NBC_01267]WSV54372.1 hypothetical protein OG282_11995 [Streptomyces sp. NBC_01014]